MFYFGLGFLRRSAVLNLLLESPTDFFSSLLPDRHGTNDSSGFDIFHLCLLSSETLILLELFLNISSVDCLFFLCTCVCLDVFANARTAAHFVLTWKTTGKFLGRQLSAEFSFVLLTSTSGVSLIPNLTCTNDKTISFERPWRYQIMFKINGCMRSEGRKRCDWFWEVY